MVFRNVAALLAAFFMAAYCGENAAQDTSTAKSKISITATGADIPATKAEVSITSTDTAAAVPAASPVDSSDAVSLGILMEKQSMDHYASLVTAAPTKELAQIYKLLVRDETKHYKLLLSWQKEIPFKAPVNTDILSAARDIMAGLAVDSLLNAPSGNSRKTLEHILRNDLALELQSVALYENGRAKARDGGQKMMFTFLVKEEKKHARLLEKLIDFSKQPEAWLKNAEYRNFGK